MPGLVRTTCTAPKARISHTAHTVCSSPELPTPSAETKPEVYPPSSKALLLALHRIQAGIYTSTTHAGLSWSLAGRSVEEDKIVLALEVSLNATRPVRVEYSLLVARYLHQIYPLLRSDTTKESDFNHALLRVFDDNALAYLSKRGHYVGDVMAWSWILATPDAFTAIMRYKRLAQETRVPMFVLMFLLRRIDIDELSFDLLLKQCQVVLKSMVQTKPHSSDMEPSSSSMPEQLLKNGDRAVVIAILTRLANLARKVAPRTLVNVAKMFTSTFASLTATKDLGQLGPKKARRITVLYNKFIQRLAGWCRVEPYHSAKVQQKAVFHILREMETFNPPLPVNKATYQAITQILLACTMTKAEKQWDSFKAVSWPPWKEDKLGIDAEKTEGSKSKAMESITQMQQAGYHFTEWDRAASVVAGWDTDGTPTIQKRTRLPSPNSDLEGQYLHPDPEPLVWAARIRATRTLREAWACYVSSQQQNVPLTEQIIHEIVEKLISYERIQDQFNQLEEFGSQAPISVPSDGGKEVHPEPTSPRDVIYVPSEPPTLPQFLQQTFSRDFPLPDKVLVLVLRHTSSLKQGLDYIDHSTLTDDQIHALFAPSSKNSQERMKALNSIHDVMFSAVIRFLCRCASHSTVNRIPNRTEALNAMFPILVPGCSDLELTQGRALTHAVFLMEQRVPRYMPAWHNVFKAIAIGSRPYHDFRRLELAPGVNRVFAWEETLRLVEYMKANSIVLDLRCIQLLCNGLVGLLQALRLNPSAVKAGRRAISRLQLPGPYITLGRPLATRTSNEMVEHALTQLRLHVNQFLPLERGQHSRPLSVDGLSIAPVIPTPSILHSLIRAFGRGKDRKSIVAILHVLQAEAHELKRVTNERRGGRRMLRRAVIASRAFLENDLTGLREDEECRGRIHQHTHPLVQEARILVDETDMLAPWPSDEEVDTYIQHEILDNFTGHDEAM
ncbi:hypothetical protein MaudCBS49596_004526 [Microsporum audouinii]